MRFSPQVKNNTPYNPLVNLTSSNLPIVIINTNGNQIVDEPKIPADMGIIFNGDGIQNNITDPFNNYNSKIGIEIRGSSSQMFPKKQYGFETIDITGDDSSVSLLGFPEESDWILYAPYSDKSLIRNVLLYRLANDIGHYATRSKFCELILNNQYMGIYVLFEKIKRDKNRVNISKIEEKDSTGDDLTGGYIIKIDKDEGGFNAGWFSQFSPYTNAWQRVFYQYDNPDPEDITVPQANYIQSFIYEFESLMTSPGFADPLSGYESFIDVNSFIDYFLLNEVSKNVDSYRISTFMHKNKDSKGGKLKMGPVWDYNLAFGNSNYFNAWLTEGFHLSFLATDQNIRSFDSFQPPFWWHKLLNEPSFKSKLNSRWYELRQNQFSIETIYAYIDSLSSLLNEPKERNFEQWQILGTEVWPNYFIGDTYEEEITYLKTWIKNRMEWIDKQLTPTSVSNDKAITDDFILYQNYPNPFNPVTKFKYTIPSAAIRQGVFVQLKVYDILGNEITTLVNENKQPGDYEAGFDASNLSSGIYYYRLTAGNFSEIKKMVLMK
ncbi:MAG: CotH kinase family protein [Ignavibacteriaceae bacterium]